MFFLKIAPFCLLFPRHSPRFLGEQGQMICVEKYEKFEELSKFPRIDPKNLAKSV